MLGRRSDDYGHVRLLRQFVRLTGRNSHEFQENESRLHDIEHMFLRAVAENELEGFNQAMYEGDFALDAHARYLTERRLVPSLPHIPFTADIDPLQVLDDARDIHFVRTADNVVEYRVRREDPDGTVRYEPGDPAEFKEGDIVEANITFIAFPLGPGGDRETIGHKYAYTMGCLPDLSSEIPIAIATGQVDKAARGQRVTTKREDGPFCRQMCLGGSRAALIQTPMAVQKPGQFEFDDDELPPLIPVSSSYIEHTNTDWRQENRDEETADPCQVHCPNILEALADSRDDRTRDSFLQAVAEQDIRSEDERDRAWYRYAVRLWRNASSAYVPNRAMYEELARNEVVIVGSSALDAIPQDEKTLE
ncbi:hypothetical protein NMY22_g18259 [Coprinellus aureogranulatus]|nr:hypothetical protein NMY22_g18259 [Coprinellus aureogranulatus]